MPKHTETKKEFTADDFLLSQGRTLLQQAIPAKDLIDEKIRESAELYDGQFSSAEKKYSHILGTQKLFVNKTYTNVQRILVDVVESFHFDPEEIVDIATDNETPHEYMQIVKTLMNHRLNDHPIDFYRILYEGGLDALKSHMAVFKIIPRLKTEKRKVKKFVPKDENNPLELKEIETDEMEEVVTAYEPEWDVIPPEDIFISPRSTWRTYHKNPIIHRFKKTRSELKMLGYKNVDAIPAAESEDSGNQVTTQRQGPRSPFSNQTKVTLQDEIWVHQIWDFLPSPDGELISGSYSLLGGPREAVVVGKEWEENKLPYRFSEFEPNRHPIIICSAYPESHKIDGNSFPQITKSLQKEVNAHVNQTREAVARALRPTMYVNKDIVTDLASLVMRRIGGVVQGEGPATEAMREIQMSNPLALTERTRDRINQDYWESGIPPNLLGSSSNEDTATGSTQQLQNANKKIALIVKNIAFTGLLPAFKYLLRLEQTYETDEYVNKVTGKVLGWRVGDDNIPAIEAIQGDFEIKVNIGLNKQSQLNRWLLLLDRAIQNNQVESQLAQLGVKPIDSVKFKDTSKIMDQIFPLLGAKNAGEFDIQAAPPFEQAEEVAGIASQPRQLTDSSQAVNSLSPQAPEELLGLL